MIEKQEVQKLANLSKLSFTDEEMEQLTEDMKSIVAFADMISNAQYEETKGLVPNSSQPLREDVVVPSSSQQDILKNAPTAENGFFKLPRRSE